MAELKDQIEQEKKELEAAPVIQPIVGQIKRCHICGGVFSSQQLKPFDTHLPGLVREACQNCHPQRSIL